MTLRLDDDTQAALDRITRTEGISAAAAIAAAVLEYDAKRRDLRDRLIAQIVQEDAALLERLAQ